MQSLLGLATWYSKVINYAALVELLYDLLGKEN